MDDSLAREILDELRAIRALLEQRQAPWNDEGRVAAMLRAIRDHVGDRPFTTFDIVDHVEVADAQELGAAILAVCTALSPRSLGKRLENVEGEPLEGLRVVRIKQVRAGWLWQIKPASLQVSKDAKINAIA